MSELLSKLLFDITNGRLLQPIAQMIQRGRLFALGKGRHIFGEKHSATHRPIMISTLLYRMAARTVANAVVQDAAAELSPLQLGIATPGALEAAIHTLRETLRNDPELAALLLDIENAFNEISRSEMIKAVMTMEWLRPIRAFVKMSYGSTTPILMPDADGIYRIINDLISSQGVRQGDPLASLLFACAFQKAVIKLQLAGGDSARIVAYHDDTIIVGTPEDLLGLLDLINQVLAELNLKLQPTKSSFVDFNLEARSQQVKDAYESSGIDVETKCAIILGCPVGATPEHERAFMESKLQDQLKVLTVLEDPRVSTHQAATILRISTVHKLDHWLRNVEPNVMRPLAEQFDEQVRESYLKKLNLQQEIAQIRREKREPSLHVLMASPVSLGGDGITQVTDTVDICWVAGVAAAAAVPTTIQAFHNPSDDFSDGNQRRHSHIHTTLNASLANINKQCRVENQPQPLISHSQQEAVDQLSARRSHQVNASQADEQRSEARVGQPNLAKCSLPKTAGTLFKLMSGRNHYPGSRAALILLTNIRARRLKALKSLRKERESKSSNLDKARLMSIRAQGATRIAQIAGKVNNLKVSDAAYQAYFCSRHGIHTEHDHCFGCGRDINTPNHELGCVLGYGDQVKARHNLICRVIVQALNRIGGIATLEPRPFRNNSQRPDIEWLIDGRRIFFDVAVTHPLNSTVRAKAAEQQLAAAAAMEKKKNSIYLNQCKHINAEFIPLVFESYGGYGKQFKTFIADLTLIAHRNLTLIDGSAIISDMLNHIAYHIFCLNGVIMKLASAEHENYVTRVVSSTA